MNNNHIHQHQAISMDPFIIVFFSFMIIIYLFCVFLSNKKYKKWPLNRTVLWIIGMICAAISLAGPIAEHASIDFRAHMLGHLLLGMLAPIFVSFSCPMTLLLRTIPIQAARIAAKVLQSLPIRIYSNPFVAALLHMGGLWILYTTKLYAFMHESVLIYLVIHLHIFFAGYLFIWSMLDIDLKPYRTSFFYRAAVLIFALASHGILSKYIYAYPPVGVVKRQAEIGGMLMYYGGDIIDMVLVFLFCLQWYKVKPQLAWSFSHSR
ncbi:cytochrome c oxidase assembly protein [Niallia nealsonii]|uniref:Cytochrome c oxidase assembly protein n=1 Tax=Niallia nealsonii TaxID=115979 RepID=A0A2N0Z0V1_9BACI|nr:cytochrome c oxidase assembly protein [Niallia nealsonii]PKG23131.1 hypothetical protein CWS01_13760 [Niallia nealsonii]